MQQEIKNNNRRNIGSLIPMGVLMFALVLILAVAGLLTYNRWYGSESPVPKNVVESVTFPIYYPHSMPDGFSLEPGSFAYSNSVVTYVLDFNKNKKIIINTQQKPTGFDFSQLSGDQQFTTYIGRAIIIDKDDRTTASVLTDKSWLIMNAPTPVPVDAVKQLIDSLRQIK